jgi:hypothetical protein
LLFKATVFNDYKKGKNIKQCWLESEIKEFLVLINAVCCVCGGAFRPPGEAIVAVVAA